MQAVLKRIRAAGSLTRDDEAALVNSCSRGVRVVRPKQTIIAQGALVSGMLALVDGWAVRYRTFADGRRQIVDFCLPGDMCDPATLFPHPSSVTVAALTRVTVAEISAEEVRRMTEARPRLRHALSALALGDASRQRERSMSIGKRSATERVAHLLCELYSRLQAVDWVRGECCALPLTQADIGDALGLTSIHVNRVLQSLRALDFIELTNRELAVSDGSKLQDLAFFNPSYLALKASPGALPF